MAETTPAAELNAVPPTVLVVDDEKNIRLTLRMVLTGEGYQVAGCGHGRRRPGIARPPGHPRGSGDSRT